MPKDIFKTGPPGRLRDAKCKECADKMAALQAALDDWYAMRLAEIDKSLNDSIKPPAKTQERLGKERDELLQGLGKPKDDGKAAKDKQKENTGKDIKDPKNKGKKPKDILKDKIAQALKDLQECEEKCPTSEVTPTPTPTEIITGTPTPTPTPEKTTETDTPPALPNPIKLPAPPPCFDTEDEREAFLKKWDPIAANERNEARKAREIVNLKYKNKPESESAWGVYWTKKQEIHEKSAADLQKIIDDAADKTKTPVPCGKKGGGAAKTPTPKPGKPKKAPRIATGGGNISLPEESFCLLIADNKIVVGITGTGETIGHVADARLTNLTDEPVEVAIPPGVLESRSKKNQNYGVPHTTDVALKPHESKTIPLDGVCLDRHKPPVGKGVGDDLAFNDCDPDARIGREDSDRFLRIAESVYDAADKLEEEGKLKEIPYKDPKKRKEIVEQWATWIRTSEVTGDPPPTKDDLKKVVEKQVGKVPPDKQKKIDEGIDTIFEKIELTTEKAKDLEKEDENDNEGAGQGTPGGKTYEISDNTPTPQPGTQEKKKKEGKKKKDKKKKYPPEIQKWLDDYDAWIEWASKRNMAEFKYKSELKKWAIDHSPHYKDLNDAVKKAAEKITDANKNGGKATQEDWDNLNKALQELEKSENELGKDFQKTEPGKALYKEFIDAEDIANNAKKRADESGKGIDEDLKKGILEKERD